MLIEAVEIIQINSSGEKTEWLHCCLFSRGRKAAVKVTVRTLKRSAPDFCSLSSPLLGLITS